MAARNGERRREREQAIRTRKVLPPGMRRSKHARKLAIRYGFGRI